MTGQPRAILGAALLLLAAAPASASDHADPALHPPPTQDAGITGLFAFPDGERLVLMLNLHRGLTAPPPYAVADYEYTIFLDLESAVSFENAEERARYGGSVVEPAKIAPSAAIRFRLTDTAEAEPGYPVFEGALSGVSDVEVFVGVRDDPFIFPRFFGKNVIAMALSIPFSAFPEGQSDFVLWGTTTRREDGDQVDHVGRANRTQLGRLDVLNTLPPSEHVAAIDRARAHEEEGENIVQSLLRNVANLPALTGLYDYVLKVRPYDSFPDVMIFTTRHPPGFPNGRRLEDDVAGLTCAQGDCVLQEVASIEGGWPRQTVNDRPFAATFPFLGEAWPEVAGAAHDHDGELRIEWLAIAAVALILAVLWLRRRARKAATPEVRRYRPS